MKLKGQTAIVVGAASGLGARTAVLLSQEGANLVLVDWNSCNETKALILEKRPNALILECLGDYRDVEFVNATVARAADTYGELHVLINHMDISGNLGPKQAAAASLEEHLEHYTRIVLQFVQSIAHPHMAEQNYGRIVNIISSAGANDAASSSIKALTKAVAGNVRRDGITCNVLSNEAGGTTNPPMNFAEALLYVTSHESADLTGQTMYYTFDHCQ